MNDKLIETVLSDPGSSFWLKESLQSALERDCVDAYYDAKMLASLLEARMVSALGIKGDDL